MRPPPPDPADLSPLSGLAPELASTLVSVAGDIALVIGDDGIIRNVAQGRLSVATGGEGWVGRAWVDTVTADTRRKIELLLQDARHGGTARRREVNHPGQGGADIPISWAAVQLGTNGPVLAVGRDLRDVGAIQQRLLDAQQDLERDYWQRRQADTRYQQLFQVARDAVLVVDARTLAIVEANPTANALFGGAAAALPGSTLRERVEPGSRAAIDTLLSAARGTGRALEVRARLGGGQLAIDVSATPFRVGERPCLLVRARTAEPSADFFAHLPDAAAITDSSGRVRMANPAFVKLCGLRDEHQLRGWLIGDALGDMHGQWPALLAQVRASGLSSRAAVRLHVAGTTPLLAEVSGALLAEGDQEDIGFTLRPLAEAAGSRPSDLLALQLAQLADQLGRQTLPEMLLQAGQLAERHLMETALARGHSLADAAALLAIPVARLTARMQQLGIAPRPLLN